MSRRDRLYQRYDVLREEFTARLREELARACGGGNSPFLDRRLYRHMAPTQDGLERVFKELVSLQEKLGEEACPAVAAVQACEQGKRVWTSVDGQRDFLRAQLARLDGGGPTGEVRPRSFVETWWRGVRVQVRPRARQGRYFPLGEGQVVGLLRAAMGNGRLEIRFLNPAGEEDGRVLARLWPLERLEIFSLPEEVPPEAGERLVRQALQRCGELNRRDSLRGHDPADSFLLCRAAGDPAATEVLVRHVAHAQGRRKQVMDTPWRGGGK